MELVDFCRAYLFWGGTSARKCRRHILNRRAFPSPDLGRMDTVFLGQLSERHLFAERFKRNPGFELGRMVLSYLHLASLLSSCDPTYQMVRNCATTSVVITQDIQAMCDVDAVLGQLQVFDAFTASNDPYGEHDFASLRYGGNTVFWK
jgi:hypothetical protein